jgi:hypothetical protein
MRRPEIGDAGDGGALGDSVGWWGVFLRGRGDAAIAACPAGHGFFGGIKLLRGMGLCF